MFELMLNRVYQCMPNVGVLYFGLFNPFEGVLMLLLL
jgi:hypothetical protein